MPMSTYAKNFYASLITGVETAPRPMWLALCLTTPTIEDTGATIDEVPLPRIELVTLPGPYWAAPDNGLIEYNLSFEYVLTESDSWGTVNGYAICDDPTTGAGNMLFYGALTPFTVDQQSLYLTISGLAIQVGDQ